MKDRVRGDFMSPLHFPVESILSKEPRIMSNGKNTPAPSPAPARQRASIEERDTGTREGGNQGGDSKTLPGGKDPRESQYPGPLSTSENVGTEEQKAAQTARKEGNITNADEPYATAPRAEQIEAQTAAAENPLSPQSTTINEPHGGRTTDLVSPPRPEGQRDPVPRGHPSGWKFDPQTGERLSNQSRGRARLDDDEDREEEREVELAGPVTLTADDGSVHTYQPGKQKMPRSHAEHWYLKQHLVPKKKGTKNDSKKDEE